jgi:hypothetical protein
MYTPNNASVYLRAFAGCLAGLTASGRYPTDPSAEDYDLPARSADAFAQEVDTLFGSSAPTSFQLITLLVEAEAIWGEGRSPLPTAEATLPGSYEQVAAAIVAILEQGNIQVIEEGVDPNDGGGGFSLGTWTADIIPADSPFTPTSLQTYVAVNTATGAVTVLTPLASDGVSLPIDGQEFTIKCVQASATPATVEANGSGVTVEDPSNGGTFGASGTIQAVAGGAARFKYRASDKKWISFGSF